MRTRLLPILSWGRPYRPADLRPDIVAGVTVAAMLIPQVMAYALLAGLPPQVGLYASTVPIAVYALFGTSRQLAVGPVAIVSLLTASALAPFAEEGTGAYLAAAAVLAILVGAAHLLVGVARLGSIVRLLSHAVLVGFTAAAAVIIGFSQVRHVLGIDVARQEHFYKTVREVLLGLGDTHLLTLIVGGASLVTLRLLKRYMPLAPGALIVVVGSILAVELLGLESRGVQLIGSIPNQLPRFLVPSADSSLIIGLIPSALVITLVGFLESVAVAKVYARRRNYDLDPNQELIGLGAANVASGLFGGYPVAGGFSRTAVNDSAGARTPLASLVTVALVVVTLLFLTPLLANLPNAALGAIIISAVIGLFDVHEIRRIAAVKRSDLATLAIAFAATLALGIEVGIAVAVVASLLVVFPRTAPHKIVLGWVDASSVYGELESPLDAPARAGVALLRIDSAVSFVNASSVKAFVSTHAHRVAAHSDPALIIDASGITDMDSAGADALSEMLDELDSLGVELHLAGLNGAVRNVLDQIQLIDRLDGQLHESLDDAAHALAQHGDVNAIG